MAEGEESSSSFLLIPHAGRRIRELGVSIQDVEFVLEQGTFLGHSRSSGRELWQAEVRRRRIIVVVEPDTNPQVVVTVVAP